MPAPEDAFHAAPMADIYRTLFDEMLCAAICGRVVSKSDEANDFIYVRVNDAFSALAGQKEIIGKRAAEVLPALREVNEQILIAYRRMAAHGAAERFETFVEALQMWLQIVVYRPGPDCLVATLEVVTLRKAAEQLLRQSEARYVRVMEGSEQGYWELDLRTDEFSVSPWFEATLGYELGERDLHPRNWAKYVHPHDLDTVQDRFRQHLAGRLPIYESEMRCLTKSGEWKWIHSRGKVVERDEKGRPLIASGINTDISERKKAEEELQLAYLVYQTSSEAMTVTDANGVIIAINPAFTALTGYAPEEVIGKTPGILKSGHHDRAFYSAMWHALNTNGQWQGEIWNRRKNGEVYPEWLSISTTYNKEDGSVHRRVALFSDITKKKELEELLWRQANVDLLTGLPNRRMFIDRLEQEIRKAQRGGSQMAVLYLDLDNFKAVNDSLGHAMGDVLLQEAARRLTECVRTSDTVARLGGDEFAVLLGDIHTSGGPEQVASKILHAIAVPYRMDGEMAYISASIGITLYPEDGLDAENLLMHADQAMYAAKQQGRNRYHYFTQAMQQAALVRTRLSNDMRGALAANQFHVFYQPIVDLSTGEIYKAEALVRWQHSVHGMISPADFIPLAEEIGMIVEIGDWVFREAARQAKRLRDIYDPRFQISVNKSPVQFRSDRELYKTWLDYLSTLALPGDGVVIEVTEGLMMDSGSVTEEKFEAFRSAGMQIALDDFGTGYSSLSYLKRFDFDYVKIDQSFVRHLEAGSEDMALCEAIILMAHKLGIKVIAEGVETEAHRDLLRAAGCDYAQGYLYSRPVPAEKFEALLIKPE